MGAVVAEAHQRSGDPHGPPHGDAVGRGHGRDPLGDAVALAEPAQVDDAVVLVGPVSGGVDQVRRALPGQAPALAVGVEEGGRVVEGGDLEDAHAEGLDDRPRVLVHDRPGRAGELDAVAVHDEGDRRPAHVGAVEAVEGLSRDPAGVAAVGHDPGAVAAPRPLAQGLADGGRDHHAETAAVELGPAGKPRDVARQVEAAPELLDHGVLVDELVGGQGPVVADARVGVLDGVLDALVVGDGEGEGEGRDQLEAAAQVIQLADGGQRGQGPDGGARRLDLQPLQGVDLLGGQPRGRVEVDSQGQDGGVGALAEVAGAGQELPVAASLARNGGLDALHGLFLTGSREAF